ncbi:hypothetical protein D3C85_920660 [compost metagenome]
MQLHGTHLHRANQRLGIVDQHHRLAGELLVQRGDAGDRQVLGILLEKQLAGDTVRCAHQRHRAILEFGQDPLGDTRVVLRQLQFGGAAAGVDHPVRVSDAHLPRFQADLRGCGGGLLLCGRGFFRSGGFHGVRALLGDVVCRFVIAQAMESSMAH